MKFVNSTQTPDERKDKYNLLVFAGATPVQARRWRDWTTGHINKIAVPYLLENKING